MIFTETKLKGAFVIQPELLEDERGAFTRVYCKNQFEEIGFNKEIVQINHSFNTYKGTIRGMHYQEKPYMESKIIRCIRGAVFDVIVDLRESSPTFLKWIGIELSEGNRNMIYIPEGFAHGFQTLQDHSELLYHHSNFYQPLYERGIKHNDKSLEIDWPLKVSCISARDESFPLLTNEFKGF